MSNTIDLIIKLKRHWDTFMFQSLSEHNITTGEFNGIEVLGSEEELTSNALAERMNLSASRASRVIENMVKKKVLIRDIDCTDRRKCNIKLTERGIDIKRSITEFKNRFDTIMEKQLSAEEFEAFDRLLRKSVSGFNTPRSE